MKRTILSIAVFLMIASSNNSSAQSSNDVALNLSGLITALSPDSKLKTSEAKATEVKVRSMRDFHRSYKNVPAVRWFNSESGQFASFYSNETHTRVVYDSKGRRVYTMISYTEGKLDRNVRALVKSTYYDAAIIGVHQFEISSKTIYVIKMLDQQSRVITLKVCEGKIEDMTAHAKK
jgi:hypothetical protein